jgi:hypothetical protein
LSTRFRHGFAPADVAADDPDFVAVASIPGGDARGACLASIDHGQTAKEVQACQYTSVAVIGSIQKFPAS